MAPACGPALRVTWETHHAALATPAVLQLLTQLARGLLLPALPLLLPWNLWLLLASLVHPAVSCVAMALHSAPAATVVPMPLLGSQEVSGTV